MNDKGSSRCTIAKKGPQFDESLTGVPALCLILAEFFAEHAADFADRTVSSHRGQNRRHEIQRRISRRAPQGLERARHATRVALHSHFVQPVDLTLADFLADFE